jgi:hypothetical protein
MSVLVKPIVSSYSNTVDMTNDSIGQLANILTQTGFISIKNDTNPALGSNIGRVIDLQFGNNRHYLRIYNTSTPSSQNSYIYFSIRSYDNSKDLISSRTTCNNNYNAYLLWSSNAFGFYYYSNGFGFWGAKDDSENYWVSSHNYNNSLYIYNSDTNYTFTSGSPFGLDGNGYTALLPCRIQTGDVNLLSTFTFNNVQSYLGGSFLQDGQGKRYMVVLAGQNAIAIRED